MTALLLVLAWMGSAVAERPAWDVRIILDNSCSMKGWQTPPCRAEALDPDGYALIGPAILADFAENNDELTVYQQSKDPTTPIQLAADPPAFKSALLAAKDGSDWHKPMGMAISASLDPARAAHRRAVVHIYDGDVPNNRHKLEVPHPKVGDLLKSGAHGMVFGLGPKAQGQTATMSQFGTGSHAISSGDGKAFLGAFAELFGLILGSEPIIGRTAPSAISVKMDPNVEEAWLVVLSKQNIDALTSPSSNPAGTARQLKDSGWTHPVTKTSYGVLKIDAPETGQWEFMARTGASQVDWLLLQTFSYGPMGIRASSCKATIPCAVTATFDGKPPPPGTVVEAFPEAGQTAKLTRQSDGTYAGTVVFPTSGERDLRLVAQAGRYKDEARTRVKVSQATGFHCEDKTVAAGSIGTFSITSHGDIMPEAAWIIVDGNRSELQNLSRGLYQSPQMTLPSRLDTIDVIWGNRTNGKDESCTEKWTLRPAVGLQLQANDPILIGPSRFDPVWNPLSCGPSDPAVAAQDPNGDCANCGDCSGASGFVGAGTQITPSEPIEATLELLSTLPSGVKLHILQNGDSTTMEPGNPVPFLLQPGAVILPVALCGTSCPEAGEHTLELSVRVPNVFPLDRVTGQTVTIEESVQATVRIQQSDWWTCWAWVVYLIIGLLIAAIVGYGYIRPLRFTRQSNFPTHIRGTPVELYADITAEPKREILRKAKLNWYRDQKIWVAKDGTLSTTDNGAAIRIELRREKGRYKAWIFPVAGQWLWYGPRHASTDQWPDDMVDPAVGAPLKLNHIYMAFSSNDAEEPNETFYCLLFEQQ